MASKWYRSLEDKIIQVVDQNIDGIVDASADSKSEYKQRCGYVAGLREALKLAEEVDRDVLGLN